MDYRRADDELFGKYCYIDTPWIAGEKTIYRIVRSGVRSNAWCDVPVKFKDETVTHDHREDIVFAVLDTLIDENTKIKRFALKDVEIITADRKTENSSEKPNNCEDEQMETQTETQNSNLSFEKADEPNKIIEAYSQGFKDGAEAVKAMPQTFVADGIVFAKMDEPQTDCSWR